MVKTDLSASFMFPTGHQEMKGQNARSEGGQETKIQVSFFFLSFLFSLNFMFSLPTRKDGITPIIFYGNF